MVAHQKVQKTVHEIAISGVDLQGRTYGVPALLRMNQEDFPKRFLDDLARMQHPAKQLSSVKRMAPGTVQSPPKVYQPVQRMLHVAAVQLACGSLLDPRLDPMRVESAGLVIRRLRRSADGKSSDPNRPYQAWMKTAEGRFQWQTLNPPDDCADPDPSRRPMLNSGQPWLDTQLAAATLAQAATEVCTPAFLAPPPTNEVLGRTIAYAVIPAASSELSDAPPGKPVYDSSALGNTLPTLLKYNKTAPSAPAKGASVDCKWLSDDYAAKQPNSDGFPVFSAALMMLFRQFNAFDGSMESNAILKVLDRRNVTVTKGTSTYTQPKGQFFLEAYKALIDFEDAGSSVQMPDGWEPLTEPEGKELLSVMIQSLIKHGPSAQPKEGRYQDPSRLYMARLFFRIKGHTPTCPSVLYWSEYSDLFSIAAWYESAQRSTAPIPLPDPTSHKFLKGLTPNVSFAVPDGLMAAMQGTTIKGLSAGAGGGGSKLQLNWICGFNIPLITICAFFVLNIFLILLNIVFFWLPFIKICIPIPVVAPKSGDD
jgi:hypothetical protein